MSSYNNRINTPKIPNSQNQAKIEQHLNNFQLNETNNNLQIGSGPELKKNKNSYKSLIIIIGVIIIIVIVTLILVFALRKKEDPRPIRPINPGEDIPSTIISDIITTDIIDTTENIYFDENNMNYTEAEKLIGLDSIKENRNILAETSNNINTLLSFYNNTNLTNVNATIKSDPDNLEFLIDSNKSLLEIVENDLDLYISKYSSLSEQANELSNDLSEYINSIPLNKFKEKNIILTEQFEKNIRNLATVFISNSTMLRTLNFDELKNQIEELNILYNIFLNKTKEVSENLISSIKLIIDKVNFLIIKINDGILEVNQIIGSIINETKIHEKLIEIKNISISLRQEIDDILNEFDEKKLKISTIQEEMEISNQYIEEEKYIIGNITNLISKKKTNDDIKIPELFTLIEPSTKLTNNFMVQRNLFESATQEQINNIEISVIETSTSLDLLFIMDVTGSMEPYIDKVKSDLINIIDGIIKESPGIDINLGFVGYRDYGDIYENIDFMKDHIQFKNIIKDIHASGGAYNIYTDEDVSLGLELALKKSWKSRAKLAVFIADAPAHGKKYGGWNSYSYEPERRDLEDIIRDMIKKDIALVCVKIKDSTDIMYKIFGDLYNENTLLKNRFRIIDNNNISFTTFVKDYAIQLYYGLKINSDDCLLSKQEAKEILKSQYGINIKKPDENLRFILGKCSPVLLVPGLYATKLKVEFNCKGLLKEERDTTLKNIRLYCGNEICEDETIKSEEYPLLFSLMGPFGILKSLAGNHGACLGHIATYYQNEKECPKVGEKNICHYSKYVKVGFYGGTTGTKKEGKCGLEGTMNVVQLWGPKTQSFISEHFANAANSFGTITKKLKDKNYKIGFSFAALPNDYRRYLSKNNFAIEVFKSQINRLYSNTGKPVVVVGHSLGTLVTLTNLIINKSDKEFMKKIKKFIALAPPFSGATKDLDIFFHGMRDFDTNKTKLPLFGAYLMTKSFPVAMELRPKSIAAKLFLDPSYKELGDALRERLDLERICSKYICYKIDINKRNKKFDAIFKGYFPSLLDPECGYENRIGGNEKTFNKKCLTNIYNVGECPTIIAKSVNPQIEGYLNGSYCNKYEKEYFYQGECDNKERNCLDEVFYSDKCPNVYSDENAVNTLIHDFNVNHKFWKYDEIDKNYFDDYETIKSGIKKSMEYHNEIDKIKDLPVPPVDTEIVYASFYPTLSTLILNDNNFTEEGDSFYKGGDETVPTWSSLLTGLKWIYDIKKKNLTQKVKLVEYCSRLAKSGQYKYSPDKEQNFAAISCRCLNQTLNVYGNDDDIKKCSHAQMLQDENLFDYIYSVINDPKTTINDNIDSKKEVVKKYNKKDFKNVEQKCNDELYDILDTKK